MVSVLLETVLLEPVKTGLSKLVDRAVKPPIPSKLLSPWSDAVENLTVISDSCVTVAVNKSPSVSKCLFGKTKNLYTLPFEDAGILIKPWYFLLTSLK